MYEYRIVTLFNMGTSIDCHSWVKGWHFLDLEYERNIPRMKLVGLMELRVEYGTWGLGVELERILELVSGVGYEG